MQKILFAVALLLGLAVAYLDRRPNWDDTGMTAAAIFALLAILRPKQPWRLALAVGIWGPLFGIALSQNYGSLLALVPAFAGAYCGTILRRIGRPA